MRIRIATNTFTATLAHRFNSSGHRTYWQEFGLDGRRIGVRFSAGTRDFSRFHTVHTRSVVRADESGVPTLFLGPAMTFLLNQTQMFSILFNYQLVCSR
jgi:hypothetical protein